MKLKSLLLTTTFTLSAAAIPVAQAEVIFYDKFEVAQSTPGQYNPEDIKSIDQIIADLQNLKKNNPDAFFPKYVKQFEDALVKLKKMALTYNATSRSDINYRKFSFDYGSIPARIQLAVKIGVVITTAITELQDKVQSAHTAIGFELFRSIVDLVNPLTSAGDVTRAIDRLEKVVEKAQNAADMKPNDVANTAKKESLAILLRKARAAKFNELAFKTQPALSKLDNIVETATGVRLDPRATLQKVNDTAATVKKALEEAKNTPDMDDSMTAPARLGLAFENLLTKARFLKCKDLTAYSALQRTVLGYLGFSFTPRTVSEYKSAFAAINTAMAQAKK